TLSPALLVFKPRNLVSLFCLEHRIHVRTVRENISELLVRNNIEKAHIADTRTSMLPTHDPINLIIKELLDNRMGESHHRFTVATDKTSVQKLVIRVRLEELLNLRIGVVLQHPRIAESARLTANIERARFHFRERIAQHLDIRSVDTPDASDFGVCSEILIDRQVPLKIRVKTRTHLYKLCVRQLRARKLIVQNHELPTVQRLVQSLKQAHRGLHPVTSLRVLQLREQSSDHDVFQLSILHVLGGVPKTHPQRVALGLSMRPGVVRGGRLHLFMLIERVEEPFRINYIDRK